MLNTRVSRRISIAAYTLGAIGAVGQAYLLYWELSARHPYTMVKADTYASIGELGLWLAPLVAIGLTASVGRRSIFAPVVMPVVLSPAVFAFVFRISSRDSGLNALPELGGSEFTAAAAAEQFYMFSIGLAIAGIVAAACVGVVLKAVQAAKGLP